MTKNKRDKLIDQVIDKIKEGYSNQYLMTYLTETASGISDEDEAQEIISEAQSIISGEHSTKKEDIFSLHLRRYNNQIRKLLDTEELDANEIGKTITFRQWELSHERKIKAFLKALATMKQKEVLMMLTSDATVIKMNDEVIINTNVQEPQPSFNLDAVTWEELVDFYQLLEKSKVREGDVPQSVKQANTAPISEAVQIATQPEEQVNIEAIKHEIKALPDNSQPSIDPTKKLRENLMRIAVQTMKDAGAKLNQQEQRLLDENNENKI